jgi:hypothetical protein
MTGLSTKAERSEPVTISAEWDAQGMGSIRLDYGQPVVRTYLNTPKGSTELVEKRPPVHHPSHVGVFAQLDMLSVFGVSRLAGVGVERSLPAATIVAGRASDAVRARTAQVKTVYRRAVADDVTVQVDRGTGLVAEITRLQFAERNLDISFHAGFRSRLPASGDIVRPQH